MVIDPFHKVLFIDYINMFLTNYLFVLYSSLPQDGKMETIGSPLLWVSFTLFVLLMLALDLGVFHRKAHAVRFREALSWSVVWISLALLFNACIYAFFGEEKAVEFLTGYLIEKSLSVDNIFIFILIFSGFAVPSAYQHRVLFWGILGAIAMRAVLILLGAQLLHSFHWIIYLFGGFLVLTGLKMMKDRNKISQPEKGVAVKIFKKLIPLSQEYHGQRFTVLKEGKRYATPLLLVLCLIEITDLVFAVDSIPAIFAVTSDPFIVYTSNIFAILGLRSLYFLLGDMMNKFQYLKVGLSLVLIFVGAKMLLTGIYKIPSLLSLLVILLLLGASIGASLWKSRPR